MAILGRASRPSRRPARLLTDPASPRRSLASWVLIGLPSLLAALFVWHIAAGFLHTESVDHAPATITSVRLEPDPVGVRVDVVLADRLGEDATGGGDLIIKLREPDGAVWQANRDLAPADFGPLPPNHVLAGRVGYSLLVPTTDWVRPPRHGGSASISVVFQPHDDGAAPLTRQDEERFP